MEKPNLVNFWDYTGRSYRFDCYLDSDFSKLSEVSQVYALVYNSEREILVVSQDSKYWNLPGGSIEGTEDYTDTLLREIREEANATIYKESLKPLFYQSVFEEISGEWVFISNQIRYLAALKAKGDFIEDPGGHVTKNKFVRVDKLHLTLQWGEVSEWLEQLLKGLI